MKERIHAPVKLEGEAKRYWQEHARPLTDAGILTERDVDSFALLCRVWGMLCELDSGPGADNFRTMNQFVNLSKQYQSLAKQFGLLPRERKSAKMDIEPAEKDEFGL